ncbi:hypothetical protein M427DRAFT_64107 [Gonapodya prolifera JEL478]|uniref:Uncharacterized protein n=1 Tax=Gonapodya prolifera (strain JEL478) TaxID=1344416 RepID=A0A138ZY66_GONPJ|nr:hypothetical protein M427DRAFT_64107 [Gonapodya prolifera JEL478]|eukprot:KXS09437.1 hypothetical protein M427DRAFT_64107 [Gonapodya prolifera JEL478]
MNEDDVLAKEEEALSAERSWLLRTHIPQALAELMSLVMESLKACDPEEGKPGLTLAATSGASDLLKGSVTVSGANVVKLDLTIKLPKVNRGQPYRVGLAGKGTILLQQVQNVRNNLVLALDELESHPETILLDKYALLEVITHVSDFIRNAKFSLLNIDETLLFPNRDCDSKLFTPTLPSDLVLEIYVNNASLVVSVMGVEEQGFLSVGRGKVLTRLKGGAGGGGRFTSDKPLLITDQILVETPSPRLLLLIDTLARADEACLALKEKVKRM